MKRFCHIIICLILCGCRTAPMASSPGDTLDLLVATSDAVIVVQALETPMPKVTTSTEEAERETVRRYDQLMVQCRFRVVEVLRGPFGKEQRITVIVPGPVVESITGKGVALRKTVKEEGEYILFVRKEGANWTVSDRFGSVRQRDEKLIRELRRRLPTQVGT